jgi:hypothetical protein
MPTTAEDGERIIDRLSRFSGVAPVIELFKEYRGEELRAQMLDTNVLSSVKHEKTECLDPNYRAVTMELAQPDALEAVRLTFFNRPIDQLATLLRDDNPRAVKLLSIRLGLIFSVSQTVDLSHSGVGGLVSNFGVDSELGSNLTVDQERWVDRVMEQFHTNVSKSFSSGFVPGSQIIPMSTTEPSN